MILVSIAEAACTGETALLLRDEICKLLMLDFCMKVLRADEEFVLKLIEFVFGEVFLFN